MIGLIDIDGKIPNLALMKIAAYYKARNIPIEFVRAGATYQKIYASAIFSRSASLCQDLLTQYGEKIEIGGTGYSLTKRLPPDMEAMRPDYDLYNSTAIAKRIKGIMTTACRAKKAETIVNAGIGFTSRGCIRSCKFCVVPQKEGAFHRVAELGDLINPKSNLVILNDNNITADPDCVRTLAEAKKET